MMYHPLILKRNSRRLVGVHIVSSDDVEAAKDMFRRGIALAGEAHHKQKLAENPFYKVLATKQYHECLDPSGQDVVSFELPAGWDSTATGEPVLCTAQLFEIPYRNALETDDKTLRYPLAWKHPAQLSLLVKEPTSGREERRSVLTPLPPRAARGTSGPRMRPPVVLRYICVCVCLSFCVCLCLCICARARACQQG
jgi:hypothetical protein